MKMRQQEHEFIRTSLHTREVGEVYQLSTIQRQGLVESQKLAHVVHSQRITEVTRLSEAFLEIMEKYEEKLKTPPPPTPPPPTPPPPDYLGAISAGLGMIQNVATAFMTHKIETMRLVTGEAPQEPPTKAAVARQAQKSGRPSDSAPADLPGEHPLREVPSRTKKQEPAPFRMMAKALAMDDAELALGLSTPEGMKLLFEKMSKLATSGDPITRAIDEQEGE